MGVVAIPLVLERSAILDPHPLPQAPPTRVVQALVLDLQRPLLPVEPDLIPIIGAPEEADLRLAVYVQVPILLLLQMLMVALELLLLVLVPEALLPPLLPALQQARTLYAVDPQLSAFPVVHWVRALPGTGIPVVAVLVWLVRVLPFLYPLLPQLPIM